MNWLFEQINLFFDLLEKFIERFGRFLLTLASEIGPWAAPMGPAAMSYYHLTGALNFDEFPAWVVAIAIESVGLSSAATLVTVSIHNDRNRAKRNQIEMRPIWFIAGWYLLTVIFLNVFLEIAVNLPVFLPGNVRAQTVWLSVVTIIVQALLVLLEVPASAIIAYRSTVREIQAEIRGKNGKDDATGNSGESSGKNGNLSGKSDSRKLTLSELEEVKKMFPDEIMKDERFNVTERTSRNWTPKRRKDQSE